MRVSWSGPIPIPVSHTAIRTTSGRRRNADAKSAPRSSKLHRVGEEIEQNLSQPLWVCSHDRVAVALIQRINFAPPLRSDHVLQFDNQVDDRHVSDAKARDRPDSSLAKFEMSLMSESKWRAFRSIRAKSARWASVTGPWMPSSSSCV